MRKLLKLLLSFCLVIFCLVSFGQVYQEMPQYGYRANRMAFDSTLQIPTVCGVPTLKSVVSVSKKAAIAFDSCNNKFYKYNPKTLTWSEISGGTSIDTTSLSNRINLKIDSLKRFQDSIYAYHNGVKIFQYKDSVGNYIPSLQEVTTVGATTTNTITINKDLGANGYGLKIYDGSVETTEFGKWIEWEIGGNPKYYPIYTSSTFNDYFRVKTYDNNTGIPSIDLGNTDGNIQITQNKISKTNPVNFDLLLPIVSESGDAYTNYSLQILDNNAPYITKDTVATLRDIRSTSGTTIDTSNKFVNNITRIAGKDSIIFYKGGFRYAIKDSAGGGGQNGRFGNDTATVVMVKVHNDAGVTLTNGKVVALTTTGNNNEAPAVRLANNKGDSTSANTLGFVSGSIANQDTGWVILSGKIEKLNTSAFSNGDIIYLDSISGNWTNTKPVAPYHMVYLGVVVKSNAGNGSIFVKCQNGYELDEIHDVKINGKLNNQILAYSDTQKVWKNKNIYAIVDTIGTSNRINLKVNISDTALMLSKYVKYADTSVMLSKYMRYADSAAMLSKYLKKSDTSTLSSRINLKVNISDTATMLTNYMRKSDTTSMLVSYLRKSDTTAMLSPYFRKSDTASLSNRIDSKNYAIGLGGTAITVNASTTYYFGTPAQSVTNSAAIRRIYIPVSGTLKGGQIYAKTTTATTTESWTLSLRLNNTSNTTFATVGNILTDKVFGTSSLNIAVVAGDYIEITTTTPAWVTGPGATFFYGTIFIQ